MVALTRPAVEALARDPALSLASMREAITVERRDYEGGIAIAIAHLVAGRALPIEEVAPLFEGDPEPYILLHLAGKATGDRAAALFDLVDRGRVPFEDTVVAMMFVIWRTTPEGQRAEIRPRVIRALRYSLVQLEDEDAATLAGILVEELADPNLRALAARYGIARDKAAEPFIAPAITEPISKLLVALPLEAPATQVGFTVRAAEKPGRNEPCHCGSAKKYKKCCADKDEAAVASPLPGMSWETYLRDGAGAMSADDVVGLAYADLVRVDLGKLVDAALHRAFLRFLHVRDWPHAIRALDAKAARGDADIAGHTLDLMFEALEAGDDACVQQLRARLPDDAMSDSDRLLPDLRADPQNALARIEGFARTALADEASPLLLHSLAFALLKTSPALGVLVARDLVEAANLDAETLVIEIERARAAVDLPSDQRIETRWTAIIAADAAKARGKLARPSRGERAARPADPDRETRALRSSLVAEHERATKLERELAAAREALATAAEVVRPQPAAVEPASPEALRALRDRVQLLEAQIREGNEERAELRKRLETAPKPAVAAKPSATTTALEEDPGDAVDVRGRRVSVPIFKPDAVRSLESLPAAVAALAIRTTGELAAVDDGAWHQVKQARDMTTPIYMARVGIHHRLLFEMREGRLEVLDVITRETLLHVLKRIRAR